MKSDTRSANSLADRIHCFILSYDTLMQYLFKVNGRFVYCELANKNLRSACKRAGVDIGSRTQYCFRHSFDTYMLNNLGELASEEDVRELMGHTGYRPEYDHRTPEQMLFRMQKVKPLIDQRRKSV